MTCLRAFLTGIVLGLGLARVSPSGKARASQARMRGFESRHPLQNNLRPVFSSEPLPTGGGSFEGRPFWLTSLRTSADSARFTSPQRPVRCKKNKNPNTFATFLRLGTLFRPRKAKTSRRAGIYLRFCASDYDPIGSQQSPIAKMLQSRPVFCFRTPRRPRTNTTGGKGRPQRRRQDRTDATSSANGANAMPRANGSSAMPSATWDGRNAADGIDGSNSAKGPKGMGILSASLVRRDAPPHRDGKRCRRLQTPEISFVALDLSAIETRDATALPT